MASSDGDDSPLVESDVEEIPFISRAPDAAWRHYLAETFLAARQPQTPSEGQEAATSSR